MQLLKASDAIPSQMELQQSVNQNANDDCCIVAIPKPRSHFMTLNSNP